MKDALNMTSEHDSALERQKADNDKHYYRKFMNGDNRSFEVLVIEHKDHLIYFIYRIVQNITIAEDLAQDTFVEILLHKERYTYQVSFKTYLYTIARNKAIDYIRKNQKMMLVEEMPEQEDGKNLERQIIKEEDKRLLYQAMNQMKEEYRMAVMLIDLEEMTYAQAARVLDKSDVQMKILIHRARKQLAKRMEREGFTYEKQ